MIAMTTSLFCKKSPTTESDISYNQTYIATKFASGQEAVEAIFRKDKQPQGRQPEDVPEASTQRGTKKKGKKKSHEKRDAADADLVAAAEYKNWKVHGQQHIANLWNLSCQKGKYQAQRKKQGTDGQLFWGPYHGRNARYQPARAYA